MNLTIIFGTRPEFIKIAPIALEAIRRGQSVRLCWTRQHTDLVAPLFPIFGLEPDVTLELPNAQGNLNILQSVLFRTIDQELSAHRPDLVLIQGDTTSTFVGALAAFNRRIPVAHLEAGLRTYDLEHPFPEECYRQMVSRFASYHFAATEDARQTLIDEKTSPQSILVTGNTSIDSIKLLEGNFAGRRLQERLDPFDLQARNYLLVTCHRRENFTEGRPEQIAEALKGLCADHPDQKVVLIEHPNPSLREGLYRFLSDAPENLVRLPAQDYLDFVVLMVGAKLILSDSGGVQEEAPSLNKPVLVLRETTERPEGVTAGCLRLVGTDPALIRSETKRLLDNREAYAAMASAPNPFGDGQAAGRVWDHLEQQSW
ncbi:non-hydrolyzing UDP-N-acetylglucosamine 2-epimerase [Coralliovum pocilloporae]|uniref:non-hydrolyzing UDP-N-acetylglucosamine 2-epimerase n=1 Tax=Coralliovum pocilloporae TaxID=3066369 RepID=UPI0033076D68